MTERIVVGGPKFEDPKDCWYEIEVPDERARALFTTVKAIEARQSTITEGNRRHAEIYASYLPTGFSWSSPSGYSRPVVQTTRNVIRSVCDTATALIGKNLPRPRIVTDGGDWDLQAKANDLDKFLVGVYAQGGFYPAAQMAFRDATIFGTGAFILRTENSPQWHVKAERILIDDLVVDEQECPESEIPPNYYLRKIMPIRKILKIFGKGKDSKDTERIRDAIKSAAGKSTAWPGQRTVPANSGVVIEAWHLDPVDGIHTWSIDGVEIKSEKWKHPWAPIVVLYWSPPISGFYGDGVSYRQYGRQRRINYLYRWVQRCQDLIAVPRVWVDATNGPLKIQVSNEIGEIVGVRGAPPTFQTPQAVGQEIYKWLDQLESGGYEDEGISQMSATNQLPQGIESAPAQREYSFKEGQRFAPVSQRWENAIAKETASKSLAMYKDHMAGKDATATSKWSSRRLVETIDWADVDLDTEQYEIRVEASSLMDLSPSGRMQAAIELSQTGWIPPEEGRRLIGHPDIERTDQKYNAALEYAEWASAQLKKGKWVPPCEYGDLEEQQDTVKADYLQAEMRGAPNKVLGLQKQFIKACDVLLHPPTAPMPGMMPGAMPGQGGLGGMPAGAPSAPGPAMSLAAAQGLAPMQGAGMSRQM